MKLKARGHQGSWFARIGDEDVPCVWARWRGGDHYHDPGAVLGEGKWVKYVKAIEELKQVALTRQREENGKWRRNGYIAMYKVANVSASDEGLRFDFVEKLADLK
jgi:hypothetical protein